MSDTDRGRVPLPGEQLRSGREAIGLSEADIAARLHLSVSYIRALEADDYKRLPDAAFVRGYIKNYARLVGLPADELASLFQQINQESRAEQPAPLPPAKVTYDRRLWWVGGAIGFVIAIWLLWPASVKPPEQVVVEQGELYLDDEFDTIEPDGDGQELPEQMEDAAGSATSEGQSAAAGADRLVVSFSEPCWLRVRDANGEELYVGQRDAGQTLELAGQGPFRLTLGNAAAVSAISFNDAGVRVPQAAPGQVITVRAP